MLLELIAGAFIIAFGAIVVLGHVLVAAALYKCLREDYAGGRARSATSGMTAADDDIKRATPAANLSEVLRKKELGRVGKIACRSLSAWTRRTSDFAPAQTPSIAPLPLLRSTSKDEKTTA
jgi:hypothetical protein